MIIGLLLLAHNLNLIQGSNLLRWWPVLLLMLGGEIVLRETLQGGLKLEGASIFMVITLAGLLAVGSWFQGLPPSRANLWLQGDWWTERPWEAGKGWVSTQETRDVSLTVSPNTAKLRVENPMGDISILPATDEQGNEIVVTTHITVWNRPDNTQYTASDVHINLTEAGDTAVLTAEVPASKGPSHPWNAVMYITVPPRLALDINSSFGTVEAAQLDSSVQIRSRFSNIQLTDVTGPLTIQSKFGNVDVDVPAETSAAIQLESKFGDITVSGAEARVQQSRGPGATAHFQIGQGKTPWHIESKFGDISLRVTQGSSAQL